MEMTGRYFFGATIGRDIGETTAYLPWTYDPGNLHEIWWARQGANL